MRKSSFFCTKNTKIGRFLKDMETRELTQGGEAVSTKAAKPGKKDKKGKLLILLLLLLLLLAGAVIYYLLQNKSGWNWMTMPQSASCQESISPSGKPSFKRSWMKE